MDEVNDSTGTIVPLHSSTQQQPAEDYLEKHGISHDEAGDYFVVAVTPQEALNLGCPSRVPDKEKNYHDTASYDQVIVIPALNADGKPEQDWLNFVLVGGTNPKARCGKKAQVNRLLLGAWPIFLAAPRRRLSSRTVPA